MAEVSKHRQYGEEVELKEGKKLQFKKGITPKIMDEVIKVAGGEIEEMTVEEMVTCVKGYLASVYRRCGGWPEIYLYMRRQVILHMLKRGMARTDIIRYLAE
jgi:hypothetical protein